MKFIITLALISWASISFGQNYLFTPNWKKGETKILKYSISEQEYENGELIVDSIRTNESIIKVLGSDKESYTLELLYENVALQSVIEFYDKIDEELKEYKNLKLKFKVDKKTADFELLNPKEAAEFMNNSFEAIEDVLVEKVPDMADLSNILFAPIKQIFENEENIEAYMGDEIGFLLLPYGMEMVVGKPVETTESTANPFNESQMLSATSTTTLASVDLKSNTCTIKNSTILDLTEFKQMLKDIMISMAESFGVEDSLADDKSAELDEMDFDMTHQEVIEFDMISTWVTKSTTTVTVLASEPSSGKKESIMTKTVVVE